MAASTPALVARRVCFHCAARVPAGARCGAPRIDDAERAFCCAGCLAVAQTIARRGPRCLLSQSRTGQRRRPMSGDAAEDVRARMRCAEAAGSGARAARRPARSGAAGRRDDLRRVRVARSSAGSRGSRASSKPRVNFATRRARVTFDPARTGLAALLRAVAAIGYRAYPYDPARRETLARREARTLFARTAIALLAMMQVMMFAVPAYLADDGIAPEQRALLDWASLALTLPVMLYSAVPFFRGAWRDLRVRRAGHGRARRAGAWRAFATSAVSTLCTGGAVYYDSVTMFVALLLTARYLELAARQRGADAIEALARAMPDVAERLRGWPECADDRTVPSATLAAGDLVRVRPGATVPADGDDRRGPLDLSRKRSSPASRGRAAQAPGDAVLAGSVNRDERAGRARARRGRRDARSPPSREWPMPRRARGRASPRSPIGSAGRFVAALLRVRRGDGARLARRRSITRAGGHVRGAGGLVSLRVLARDAGGADGRRRRARAPRRRARAARRDRGARRASRTSCSTRRAR